jgi:ABC-2 type transport system permease protein
MTAPPEQMDAATGRVRRMNLWRLEWLRFTRTPRAISLAILFIAIGLVEPVVTKYQAKILAHVGRGVQIKAPPPTAADGLNAYVSEVTLVGLILVVALAAGALTFDASPGLAIFLRTRVSGCWQLIAPRFAVHAAAAAVAYLLGTLAAWYETVLLLGHLPAAQVLVGAGCVAVFLTFAVAVTALAASMVRSTMATVGIAFIFLLALPVLSSIRVLARWLPSALVNAPVNLVDGTHQLGYFWPALLTSVVASGAALAVATRRLSARDV